MSAPLHLREACLRAPVVVGPQVSAQTFPQAARSYLDDGRGVAWELPHEVQLSWGENVRFAIDAEIPRPVRPVMARRFGVAEPNAFARGWTEAEVLAKLANVPIITWLDRHALTVPKQIQTMIAAGEMLLLSRWVEHPQGGYWLSIGVVRDV